jgi:hypothetical protein
MNNNFWIGVALTLGPIALLWWDLDRKLRNERLKSRSPFNELLLRPPGESLRIKIGQLEEQLFAQGLILAGLIIVPPMLVIMKPMLSTSGKLVAYFSLPCLFYAVAIIHWRKLYKLRLTLRNYRLGFDGERYMGAELNRLAENGYHVFHDFVYDRVPGGIATDFNIDHIVVGPNGIFAIETKARRKPNVAGDTHEQTHKVTFDGTGLDFANGYIDRKPIEQARLASEALADWLNGTAGTKLRVQPVIAIPGWFVSREGPNIVKVMNGKEVMKTLPKLSDYKFTPEQIRQIASRIGDHCRNVEGE